jgi:transglutaminase-like putative cysteine protease
MLITFGFDIELWVGQTTPVVALLDVHPDRATDVLHDDLSFSSSVNDGRIIRDAFGNCARRFVLEPGDHKLSRRGLIYDTGTAEIAALNAPITPIPDLPNETLTYVLASRYCETDLLGVFAFERFGQIQPGWAQVQAVCARPTRTAVEALSEQTGVCRDFAHVAITLCRCLNIPARYATGYLGDIGVLPDPAPMDFSAWFEAYIDGRWHTFDARHNRPRIGRIVMARGRDAADCALITSFGPHILKRFDVVAEEFVAPALERAQAAE